MSNFRGEATEQNYSLSKFRQEAPGGIKKKGECNDIHLFLLLRSGAYETRTRDLLRDRQAF